MLFLFRDSFRFLLYCSRSLAEYFLYGTFLGFKPPAGRFLTGNMPLTRPLSLFKKLFKRSDQPPQDRHKITEEIETGLEGDFLGDSGDKGHFDIITAQGLHYSP